MFINWVTILFELKMEKFEVKAINKWIGKYMNGEMTPYERDSGELEWWELLRRQLVECYSTMHRRGKSNSAERVQRSFNWTHCTA